MCVLITTTLGDQAARGEQGAVEGARPGDDRRQASLMGVVTPDQPMDALMPNPLRYSLLDQLDIVIDDVALNSPETGADDYTVVTSIRLKDGRPLDIMAAVLFADVLPPNAKEMAIYNQYGLDEEARRKTPPRWYATISLDMCFHAPLVPGSSQWLRVALSNYPSERDTQEIRAHVVDQQGSLVLSLRQLIIKLPFAKNQKIGKPKL